MRLLISGEEGAGRCSQQQVTPPHLDEQRFNSGQFDRALAELRLPVRLEAGFGQFGGSLNSRGAGAVK
jgi:hypothetical protein